MSTHFGRALREERTRQQVTQEELAGRIVSRRGTRVHKSHVQHLEGGRRCASALTAVQMSDALGLPPDFFMAAVFRDEQEAALPRHKLTTVIVGVNAYAASHTHESWVAIRARVA